MIWRVFFTEKKPKVGYLLLREKIEREFLCMTMGPGKKKLSIKIERDVKNIVDSWSLDII